MPLVNVHMAAGRTSEQKKALMDAVTDAMVEHIGAPRASVRVWISEFENTDFMAGGELLADKQARLRRERMPMIDRDLIERAAAQLREAAESGALCRPVRDVVGTATDIDVGYAIQQINTDLHLDAGRRISGRKIGVTSKAVQEQIGVDQPDFGTLFVDMEFGDGIEIPVSRLLQPRAEAEVALVLEHDLDKGEHSFTDMIRATAFALPAIEVVDSRIVGWDIRIVDTVADNASCGVYVLGGRPIPLRRVDLRTIPMSMSINDIEVSTGVGAACLGHPLHAARWLADVMCARNTPLRAGDVVMTGALGPMKPIAAGDAITATFGDLGTVTTHLGSG